MDVIISGPWMLAVDPQMLWGTDEVCVDVIMGLDWGRVRSGWTLSWFCLMDALGNGWTLYGLLMDAAGQAGYGRALLGCLDGSCHARRSSGL